MPRSIEQSIKTRSKCLKDHVLSTKGVYERCRLMLIRELCKAPLLLVKVEKRNGLAFNLRKPEGGVGLCAESGS